MATTNEITNYEDHLDSRDVQERIDYLRNLEGADFEEYAGELETLLNLKEQYVDYYGEDSWSFGAQFIRESYFEGYAQELAEDCGLIKADAVWPNNCIDWEQAARELAMDYTTVTFDGVDYYTQEA